MSIHTDALRDIAANHGWPVCDQVADELDDHENAYALLFAENATLRTEIERLRAENERLRLQVGDAAVELSLVSGPIAHRIRVYFAAHAKQIEALQAERDAARASVKGST